MSAEIGEWSDLSAVDSSRLADTGLVTPATKPSGGKFINAPTRQGPPHPSTIRDSTSSKKPNETAGMFVVRQYYETRGVSKSAVGLLMASWRGGTKKQYSGYVKKMDSILSLKENQSSSSTCSSSLGFPFWTVWQRTYLQCYQLC